MADKRTHIEIHAPVLEMEQAIELSALVKVDQETLREVTEGDPEPKFVISSIEEQKSANNVNYDSDAFHLIASQVNEKLPNGYLGHIKDSDRDTAFPLPQVLWLGATVHPINGKAHLIAKGYVPPEGQARGLIKRKMINSVSWAGDALLVPAKEGGYKLKEYVLESIDFARKHKAGLKNQNLVLVTEEMRDDNTTGGKKRMDGEKDYGEIVGTLNYHELNTHNPALVTTIKEMAKEEVKDATAQAVAAKEKELTDAHTAEIEAMPEKTTIARLMELLKLDKIDKVEDQVVALLEQLDDLGKKAIASWFNNEILPKKVQNEKARALVGRLIPVTEMEGDWRTEKGLEAIKQKVEERVDDALENDEAVKIVLTEMSASRGGLRLTEHTRSDARPRSENNDKSDVEKVAERSGGNLAVERVRVG